MTYFKQKLFLNDNFYFIAFYSIFFYIQKAFFLNFLMPEHFSADKEIGVLYYE